MLELKLPSPESTLRLGEALAAGAAAGRVLFISGDLGAGKTTLVRGLLRGLGYAGRAKSPTYALVEPYSLSSLDLYHFDFYRFKDRSEWLNSGFREHFNPGSLCVVEWPEKAGDLLLPPDLHVFLEFDGEARRARLEARSEAGRSWLSSLRVP
jgi:tRNA threonylcarbamoyladenosine biosynthesis protein TsaE